MSIIQGNSKTSAGGYTIDQSLRFNISDSAYLERTPSSSGNAQTWTLSFWVKRANLSSEQELFFAGTSSTQVQQCQFDTGDTFQFECYHGATDFSFRTTQVFRDVGSWYHFVFVADTTQSTSTERIRMYVNGERITSFSTATYPAQNHNTFWNTTVLHQFGRKSYVASLKYLGGYLAEIHNIDGQALDPSSFGEVNADTGQWVPVAYTGSYGTNGFYITGENSAALGTDYSGNGNNFTSSGLTSADQMLDTPTNVYSVLNTLATTGGVSATFSDGNLKAVGGADTATVGSMLIPETGKYYWEITINSTTYSYPVSAIGVASSDEIDYSIARGARNPRSFFFQNVSGSAGEYAHYISGSYTSDVSSLAFLGTSVVAGVAFDADNNALYISIGGTFVNSGNPVGGTGGLSVTSGKRWVPMFHNGAGSVFDTYTVNFGQSSFIYTPPTGFSALSTANLSDPTIADPTAHFNTVLWTGDGASSRTISGVGFNPDFVWAKRRSVTGVHQLMDDVRGANLILLSDSTSDEINTVTGTTGGGLGTTTTDGFTIVSGTSSADNMNGSGITFVGWNWKANGSGSSNTDGSITSTVSANTTSGFSIIQYTGNATATQTVGHGLGVTPGMVIIKKTSASGNNWQVWHQNLSATSGKVIELNTTAAEQSSATIFETAPTSSVFGIGSADAVNASGATFIAYCFAEVEGFSKFGKYTGNGSADGPFVYCGFQPAFVLGKRATGSTGYFDWWIFDDKRPAYNLTNGRLYPNLSATEDTGAGNLDFVSNGFKIRSNTSSMNNSGDTFIFAAFAQSPQKTATAR